MTFARPHLIAPLLAIALLAGCTPKPLKREVTVLETRSDGLVYAKPGDAPYTGPFVKLAPSGEVIEEINYADGILHGPNTTMQKNGIKKRCLDYDRGIRVRKRTWYLSGQIRSDEGWNGKDAIGLCRYWFEDGRIRKLMKLGKTYFLEGHVLEYAEDGTILIDAIVEHRVPTGYVHPSVGPNLGTRYADDEPKISSTAPSAEDPS